MVPEPEVAVKPMVKEEETALQSSRTTAAPFVPTQYGVLGCSDAMVLLPLIAQNSFAWLFWPHDHAQIDEPFVVR